jgi:hypothetical protein
VKEGCEGRKDLFFHHGGAVSPKSPEGFVVPEGRKRIGRMRREGTELKKEGRKEGR